MEKVTRGETLPFKSMLQASTSMYLYGVSFIQLAQLPIYATPHVNDTAFERP
jgi:hypothetical protein